MPVGLPGEPRPDGVSLHASATPALVADKSSSRAQGAPVEYAQSCVAVPVPVTVSARTAETEPQMPMLPGFWGLPFSSPMIRRPSVIASWVT